MGIEQISIAMTKNSNNGNDNLNEGSFVQAVLNDKPARPHEIPDPGKEPETIPAPEPGPGVWPKKQPEIQPEREPLTKPPGAPPEIPPPPGMIMH
jgi:hypothetical protein